jgi:ribosomal 50S subunit-recycling heat shock protein
MQRADKT